MCIVVWIQPRSSHPEYKLILVSNRDEDYDRPTSPFFLWDSKDYSSILAGKDILKGGTWFGVNVKNGCFGTLTNLMTPFEDFRSEAKSRGNVLLEFLNRGYLSKHSRNSEDNLVNPSVDPAFSFLNELSGSDKEYNGFNILLGNVKGDLYYYGSGHPDQSPQLLEKDRIYGLSNALLDTPWFKICRAKELFSRVLCEDYQDALKYVKPYNNVDSSERNGNMIGEQHEEPDIEIYPTQEKTKVLTSEHEKFPTSKIHVKNGHRNPENDIREEHLIEGLFNAFCDDQKPKDDKELPNTGIGIQWERWMSSIFVAIESKRYGTRSQTVLLVRADNTATLVERSMKIDSLTEIDDVSLKDESSDNLMQTIETKPVEVKGSMWIQKKFRFSIS
jgi:uncharacterized protein with NRDE domain